ncbi:MAG TPA: 4Fe-4S binding protein [Clostridia bacterium]|nr:4Fe-4S binding protein [Clostridia bacterium]
MEQRIRTVVQLVFLVAFIALWRLGKMQVWMSLILASAFLAAILGRVYCGWICPIHTLMRPLEWVKARLGSKHLPVPSWVCSPVLKYGLFVGMIVAMILTTRRGIKLPLMLLFVPPALLLTFFYHPASWHRYLCPYGTLFSLTARWAFIRLYIDENKCSSCSLCTRVCPAEAISLRGEKEYAVIDRRHCLVCLACKEACPRSAIAYSARIR